MCSGMTIKEASAREGSAVGPGRDKNPPIPIKLRQPTLKTRNRLSPLPKGAGETAKTIMGKSEGNPRER